MQTFYRFQYNTGELSMIVKDEKDLILNCCKYLTQKTKYPVCIWIVTPVKPKKEEV